MKLIKLIISFLLFCAVLVTILYCFREERHIGYTARTEVEIMYKELSKMRRTFNDLEMINIRIMGAINDMSKCHFMSNLIEKYIKENTKCTIDKARSLLLGVSIKQKNNSKNNVWIIQSSARIEEEAIFTSVFYADRLAEYFINESNLREEKISAWFNQQIYYKQKRNENVEALKKRKQEACQKEQENKISVKKIKTYILK